MIDGLKPYAETKDSGAVWLGAVPAHWDVWRGKWLFRNKKEINSSRLETNILSLTLRGVVNNDPNSPEGLVPKDYGTYQRFAKDDLVFKLIDLENLRTSRVGLVHEDGIMSPAYVRLSKIHDGVQKYFFHQYFDLYQRGVFNQLGAGVRSTLGAPDLLDMPVVVPAKDEQVAIVRFLDHADRRIRRAVAAKQKLIRLLVEQKRVIIHRAVTSGIDFDVHLKPSGIEWIGDVPEHWTIYRIKQVSQILRGKFTHRPRNDPSLYDGPYPFIQTGEVARSGKIITTYRQTLNERGLAVSKMFPKGTLVMTIAANIGEVAILDFEACFPDSVVGFVPRDHADRDYLYYVFTAMKPELLREAPVNTQGNLNIERVGCRGVALPPLDEQQRIVVSLEKRTMDVDAAIERSVREISLLREFRSRLAADVVTGKLDVRAAAAQLPESTDLDYGEFDAIDEVDDGEESIDEAAVEDQAA
jgi:type I restriction enzyme S subunit